MIAIFLDIETTGLDCRIHQPIDIALKVVDPSDGSLKASYQSVIRISEENWALRDPFSMEVNGYTWEEVQQGKDLPVVSSEILHLLQEQKIERGKAAFICQNPAFDKSFFTKLIDVYSQEKLNWPYHWLDFASMYWAERAKEFKTKGEPFASEINLSKNAIALQYNLPEEVTPHKAMNGVDHLILCYKTVIGFPLLKEQDWDSGCDSASGAGLYTTPQDLASLRKQEPPLLL